MTRLFEPDWPALYSAGLARIPLKHGAYARLSRPFLDFFVGRSGYETTLKVRLAELPSINAEKQTTCSFVFTASIAISSSYLRET